MNTASKGLVSYQLMVILTLIVGITGIAFQFLPGFELMAFMLTVVVLGGLSAGNNSYEEQDRQRLRQSYQRAFDGLLLAVMAAYALLQLSKWSGFTHAAGFLNEHWPGLILSLMCIAMGIAGLQKAKTAGSA